MRKTSVCILLVMGLLSCMIVPVSACDSMDYYSPANIKCPVKKCKNYSSRYGKEQLTGYYIEEKTINGLQCFREVTSWTQNYKDTKAHVTVRNGRHYCPWQVHDYQF